MLAVVCCLPLLLGCDVSSLVSVVGVGCLLVSGFADVVGGIAAICCVSFAGCCMLFLVWSVLFVDDVC